MNLSRKLIFNEVAWMGSPPLAGETALAASNREWMELKNISGSALDISGWQVLDAAGNIKIVFDNGARVPAGNPLLLERGDGAVPSVQADKVYSGALSNVGGVLAIVDTSCSASDVLDASAGWPAGNKETEQTLERDADGVGWHTSASPGGTPRAENSVSAVAATATVVTTAGTTVAATTSGATGTNVTSTASSTAGLSDTSGVAPTSTASSTVSTSTVATTTTATATTEATTTVSTSTTQTCAPTAVNHLVIAEIQIAGASSTNDFIKIFNPTASAVDMSGWKLRKKSKSGADYSLRVFPGDSAIAAGGYFMWANSENGFGDSIGANVISTETLAADNSAALFDASGTIVDQVAWGEGANQYVETTAYPANPEAGQVLKRKSVDGVMVDTENNANDFTI